MKWLKRIALGLVATLALATLTLFAASQRADAGHNHGSIVIDRPAAEVFGYFTDYAQVQRWVPMFTRVRFVRGDRIAPGSIARLGADGVEEDEEIVALEPGSLLRMRLTGTHGEFDEDCTYTFREEGGRTTVTADARTRYHGALALLEPLITRAADKATADALDRLKGLAEGEGHREASR